MKKQPDSPARKAMRFAKRYAKLWKVPQNLLFMAYLHGWNARSKWQPLKTEGSQS